MTTSPTTSARRLRCSWAAAALASRVDSASSTCFIASIFSVIVANHRSGATPKPPSVARASATPRSASTCLAAPVSRVCRNRSRASGRAYLSNSWRNASCAATILRKRWNVSGVNASALKTALSVARSWPAASLALMNARSAVASLAMAASAVVRPATAITSR